MNGARQFQHDTEQKHVQEAKAAGSTEPEMLKPKGDTKQEGVLHGLRNLGINKVSGVPCANPMADGLIIPQSCTHVRVRGPCKSLCVAQLCVSLLCRFYMCRWPWELADMSLCVGISVICLGDMYLCGYGILMPNMAIYTKTHTNLCVYMNNTG